MRKTVAVLALGLLGVAPAQAVAADPDTTALRNAVNRAEVLRYEQRLQTIAMSNENHRLTASTGNWESVDFVISELRKIGYNPTLLPYANTSAPNAWSERTPSTFEVVSSPTPITPQAGTGPFLNGTAAASDFAQMTWSQTSDITAQLIPASGIQVSPQPTVNNTVKSGCVMSDFPAAVKDNIVLVQRGTCTELVKAINARASGAKALIIMNEGSPGRTASARFVSQTYPGTVGYGVTFALGKQLYEAAQQGPVTLRLKSDNNLTQRIDYDILAETPGGDPTRVLQVGAHMDGVNAGPGINDDGSGTSMNLAIANQIMKLGIPLKYKIRFGWFSGEEQGLFGSTFAVNQLNTVQTQQTLGMLDYDMLGSTNWIPFMYVPNASETALPTMQRDSEAIMSNIHINYLQNRLGITKTDYPFDNRSDYAQWRSRQVPATGYYTGAETSKTAAHVAAYGGQVGIQADPCYHEWCDTVFNLSQYGLDEFTDVLANGVLSLAGVGTDAVELPVRPELLPAATPTPTATPTP